MPHCSQCTYWDIHIIPWNFILYNFCSMDLSNRSICFKDMWLWKVVKCALKWENFPLFNLWFRLYCWSEFEDYILILCRIYPSLILNGMSISDFRPTHCFWATSKKLKKVQKWNFFKLSLLLGWCKLREHLFRTTYRHWNDFQLSGN